MATITWGRVAEGMASGGEEGGGRGLSRGRNEMKRAYIRNRKRREVEHFEIIFILRIMEWAKASIRHSEGGGRRPTEDCYSCNSNQFPSNSRIFAFWPAMSGHILTVVITQWGFVWMVISGHRFIATQTDSSISCQQFPLTLFVFSPALTPLRMEHFEI